MATCHRPAAERRRICWSWLFWLALALPVSQTMAGWHALSHLQAPAVADDGDKKAPHVAHCDLCLSANALAGGGMVSRSLALPITPMRDAAPPAVNPWQPQSTATLAYRSRAPPTTAC